MTFLRRWWWPAFAFIYPLIFVPWERNVVGLNYAAHMTVTGLFLVIGAFLEASQHPSTSIKDIVKLPNFLRVQKQVLATLLLGAWAIFGAFFALEPTFALMGTLPGDGGGALGMMAFSIIFVLIFMGANRDKEMLKRLLGATLISGLVLALIAIVEALRRQGLVYPLDFDLIPKATLPQRGHFAGFLLVSLSLALVYWLRGRTWALLAILVIAFAIGITLTRTAIFVALIAAILGLVFRRFSRSAIVSVAVVAASLALGMQVIQLINNTTFAQGSKVHKEFADSSTASTRWIYWKTALRGMIARPIFGWGAGGFDYVFPQYMTKLEREKAVQIELGVAKVIDYISTPGAPPVFVVKDKDNKTQLVGVVLWKSHNQFLEIGLRFGIVGLLLYLYLFLSTWRAFIGFKPAALALWIYHLFLLFWFIPFHTEGVVWVLMACATLESLQLSRVKVRGVSPAGMAEVPTP